MGVSRGITLVIVWIVLFGTISFMPDHSSSSVAEKKQDLDYRAGGSNVSPVCCPEKWIMKSYFADSEALLDSHFQDFKHKLNPCLCEALRGSQAAELDLSGLERHLIGEGSHRRLSSSIRIKFGEKSRANLPAYSCEVIIIERLPSGIFADPFELQHLLQRGVFSDVAVFGDTDLELPTVRSNRTVVEIHMDVGPNNLSSHEDELAINLHIPLHVRYPPLDDSGYVTAVFGEPDIFARCRIDGKPFDHSCLSTVRSDDPESIHIPVAWAVPSGIERHARLVSAVTFLSAALSAIVIILATVFYLDGKSCKSLKQS